MQISQTQEQIRALSSLQAHCEIRDITLLSSSVSRAKAGNEFKAPFSAKPALSNVSPVLRGSSLVVEVSFEYSAWDSSEPPERLFAVHCTFEVDYELRPPGFVPSDEELASFCRGTAVFNCWPYAREYLRDITSRIGHRAPTIPLLRIVPKKSEPEVAAELRSDTKVLTQAPPQDS